MGAPRQSWVGIACLVALAAPGARAAIPVPASAVERALDEVARSPTAATSYARLLALLTVMDALPPERRRAWLDRLAALERAPLMAARARFERLALADPPWTAASLTGSAARDGANLGLLTDARVAVGDDAPVMPVLGPRGAIALEPLLHPPSGRDHARVAFGLCAARRVDLVLRLGASGDVIVALDGRALGHADDLSRAAIDQLEVPLALEPGRHELLVVVHGHGREPPVLYARLTDRAGRPAPEHACAPEAPGPAPDNRGEALPPPAALRALASPWRPLALRLLGHPGHAADLAAAIEGEAHSVARRLGPTFTAIAIDALPTAEARLTLATNLTPAAPLVEAALAADRGQLVRARDRLATAPDQPERRLVEARILREAGDPEAALALLSEPADASTTSEARLVERARAALAAGRPDLADEALAAVMTIVSSPERVDLHAMRVRALVALGRPDEAVRAAAALARARPDRPVLALEAAERALHASDAATARAMIDLARPTLVWKPDALVAAARIEGALGRTDEGRVLATRALALEPAHEDARRWLEDVAGTEPAPLTITASDTLARLPALDPEAPWEVVAEELVMRVADDGSATKWLRRVLRAQHPPEARADRTFSWRFDPSQESVRVLGARVVAPDGRVSVARERHIRTAAEDWYNLYFDVRVLEIPFDRLPVGALVEVTLRIDPVGQHFPGVFELVEVLRDRVPKHRHRIVVDAPVSLGLRSAVIAGDGATIVEAREPSAPGRERLVLEASGLAALPHEPLAPGAAETSPVWQLTTFPSWAEVGRWYRSLLASQVVVTPEMRADVQAIVAAEGGVPARVTEALVALVRDHIRYVGLEFGIHGYQPYRTDEVWARRFGDCKDQALLLRTLLSLADIPAEVALVRTRGQGRLAGALPSLALFDHAIVHLPERGLFVDSTVLHHGIGELPAADQGAQVLLVTDDAQLALTPVDAPTRNQVVGAYSVTLDPDGGGGIQGTVAFHGAQAPPYRAALADPATQHDKLQAVLNRRYPGLVLDGARLSDPEVVDRPFDLVFHATVPRLASVIGDTLHVLRPAGIDGQAERLASLPTRALPLVPGPPMTFDLTFRYVLPTGYRVRELPRGGAAEGAFGRWAVTWTAEPGVVTVATTLQWAVDQIEAARYPALRAFVRAFDQAVGAALVLERGAP